ncbi:MAG TPA: YdeI/OmpD-associated family protein [Candidatus Paceibacterota bacterium]
MQIKPFATTVEWRAWLAKMHAKSDGIWVRIYKKASGKKTVTYAKALDDALCFGWIDGQKKAYDAESFLQRFTPRRPKSIWSKRNREHVARLIKEKRMTAAGLREVAAAKRDGRWDSAYDAPSSMQIPEDFLKNLKKDQKAYEFFKTLNRANVYAIAWRLQTAKKAETRVRRMEALLSMMSEGKKLH